MTDDNKESKLDPTLDPKVCSFTDYSIEKYVPSFETREDPGSVEITQHQIDSYGPIEERTNFKSKVEESIYRARKDLFKKTGEIY